jgi:plastocyanin
MAGERTQRAVAACVLLAGGAVVLGPVRADERATGRIAGFVGVEGAARFEGTPPPAEPIDMASDPYCVRANTGRTVVKQAVQTGAGGALRDAIVYVREGPVARGRPVPQETVLLDQQDCVYTPHVVAVRAGQTLVIRNSDETLHNVHVRARNNREFNIGQPFKGVESRRTFTQPEVGIHVACDVHGWMSGVIAVFDHDGFAVSRDDGAFSLADLPPGDYVLEAWHETLGTQTQRVTVTAGQTARVTFTFPS